MSEATNTVDVTPSPRVLRMLGQIEFAPWQCLAELIDNSIDALLDTTPPADANWQPEIDIDLPSPSQFTEASEIRVRDNGRGMDFTELTNAVRAGYSGNGPVDKLGLFGMGFNIATARLGSCTEIWTTTRDQHDWVGIRVKFDEMETSGTYAVPRLTRPKHPSEISSGVQGTEIRVSHLDFDRVRKLTWGTGKSSTRQRLGKLYGRVIANNAIRLNYDGEVVRPTRHCVWDASRAVETRAFGNIRAQIEIDETLTRRRYCTTCWVWLLDSDRSCPACGLIANLIERQRKIIGRIGIQRYFHKEHYGIDLIRNGRVIEELDKSLFYWVDPDTTEEEKEYPIDAVFLGGRIVGELEIDFVRVSHQKNAFDKLDPQWTEVVTCIRGASPIRPNIAKARQLELNTSPLARLFAGYRYGYAGLKHLVAGHRDGRARDDREFHEWTERFRRGDLEYQSDEKWYEQVLLAEQPDEPIDDLGDEEDPFPIADLNDEDETEDDDQDADQDSDEVLIDDPALTYAADELLSGVYSLPNMPGAPSITVVARTYRGSGANPPLVAAESGTSLTFDYDPAHSFFRDDLESPAACLASVLAHQFLYLAAASQVSYPMPLVERELLQRYFPEAVTTLAISLDVVKDILSSLRVHLGERLAEIDPVNPDSLDSADRDLVSRGILTSALGAEEETLRAFATGQFIHFVSVDFLATTVHRWPELLLDGMYFSVPYGAVSEDLRLDAIGMVGDALRDAIWFVSDVGVGALNRDYQWRLRVARAESSIRLLEFWRR